MFTEVKRQPPKYRRYRKRRWTAPPETQSRSLIKHGHAAAAAAPFRQRAMRLAVTMTVKWVHRRHHKGLCPALHFKQHTNIITESKAMHEYLYNELIINVANFNQRTTETDPVLAWATNGSVSISIRCYYID